MSVARARTDDMLALVCTVAAATEDATPDQKRALEAVVPDFQRLRTSRDPDLIAQLERTIERIMGPTWKPSGRWATARQDAHQIINDGIRSRGHDPAQLFAPK